MPTREMFSKLVMALVAALILCLVVVAIPASAQSNAGNYAFLVGSGFLCDSGDSANCPAVVRSANGDSYEVSGAGTFDTKKKLVTATGTFTRRSPNGDSLETGIWLASELVSFESYGIALGARMQAQSAFGPPQFGSRWMPMRTASMPEGGLAIFHIRLLPMRGPSRSAALQVNCALGRVPEERQTEGIRLTLGGSGGEFDEEVSGRTMFVLTRLAASPAKEPPAAGDEPAPTPARVQQ